jgi:DNA-damage-inducible protein D
LFTTFFPNLRENLPKIDGKADFGIKIFINCQTRDGVKGYKEYAILTAEISKATFGLTPAEYKSVKGLTRENLRDHMTDLELIFSMLGEASTTAIVKTQDPQGLAENKKAAKQGGTIAGNARKELEAKTQQKVVTQENYLSAEQKKKLGRGKNKAD